MKKFFIWTLRIVPSLIFFQTLFFKFSAHPDSVALFTKLGIEPIGRIGIGIAELASIILMLNPKSSYYGSLLGFLIMLGAIISHVWILGINYGGYTLFILAIIAAICCLANLFYSQKN